MVIVILFVFNEYILLLIFVIIFGVNIVVFGGVVVVGILEIYYGYEYLEFMFGVNFVVIGIGNLFGFLIVGKINFYKIFIFMIEMFI